MIRLYAAVAFRPEIKGLIRDLRPTWLLEEMGVPYERIALDPRKGETKTKEHSARSHFNKIPAIQDGDFTLFESGAIVNYLADKYAKLIPPAGTRQRAVYDQWVFAFVTNLEPQNGRLSTCDISRKPGETTREIRELAVKALEGFLKPLEEKMKRDDHVMGQSFSAADIMLTTSLLYTERCGELRKYPAMQAYIKRMMSRPAFGRAFELNGNP